MRCNVWRQAPRTSPSRSQRGTRVIVHRPAQAARLRDPEGEKRTVVEMEVDEVGPSLRYATAKVTKASAAAVGGGGSGGGFGGGGQRRPTTRGPAPAPAVGGAAGGGGDDSWGSRRPTDEPPF